MSLEQILIIAFGIVAIIDIWLVKTVKMLRKGFSFLVSECQNNTAFIFHLKKVLNVSDVEYERILRDFNELVDNYEDIE